MTGIRWTVEELDAKVKRGNVKIVGARVIRRMDGEPETKHANKPAKAAKVAKAAPKAGNAATATKTKRRWDYEGRLAEQLRQAGIHRFVMEHRWHPTRKFRADLAFPVDRWLVEIQGEAHRIKSRFHSDIEKFQQMALHGWRLLPVSTRDVKSGKALVLIKEALGT